MCCNGCNLTFSPQLHFEVGGSRWAGGRVGEEVSMASHPPRVKITFSTFTLVPLRMQFCLASLGESRWRKSREPGMKKKRREHTMWIH